MKEIEIDEYNMLEAEIIKFIGFEKYKRYLILHYDLAKDEYLESLDFQRIKSQS